MDFRRHRGMAACTLAAWLLCACERAPAPAEPAVSSAGSLEPTTLIAMDFPQEGGVSGVGIRPGTAASGISP